MSMSSLPRQKSNLGQNLGASVNVDQLNCEEFKSESKSTQDPDSNHLNSALDEHTKIVFGQLLRKILTQVNSTDLLENARLVSKTWRDEATWILRQRLDSFGAKFKFHPRKNSFLLFKSKTRKKEQKLAAQGNKKDLSELTELLNSPPSHNSHFPTTHFHFEGGSLDCPQILKFFNAHGKKIQKLTVDVRKNPLTRDGALRQNIMSLTPQLTILELTDSDKYAFLTEPAAAEWSLTAENISEVNSGQGQGQGQNGGQLKTLMFAESISHVHVIQRFLSQIEPELAKNRFISIAKCTYCDAAIDPDIEIDVNPQVFNHRLINQISYGQLILFDFNSNSGHRLDKFADCRLKFKEFALTSSRRHQSSMEQSMDLPQIGKALWRILDGTKETLTTAIFWADTFPLLTRLPFSSGFFPNVKTITVKFCPPVFGQDDNDLNFDLNLDLYLPRRNQNPDADAEPDPPLWKNLSDVMPSLEEVHLNLFDGDYESWLPFFDRDAGENSTVKKLFLKPFYRRDILQKNICRTFPFLNELAIEFYLTPPPSTVDSWQKLIRWLFCSSDGEETQNEVDEKKIDGQIKSGKETGENDELIPEPLANFKFLQRLWLRLHCSCSSSSDSTTAERTNTSPSRIQSAEPSGRCSWSKISGSKLILLNEDHTKWRESSDDENNSGVSTSFRLHIKHKKLKSK